MSNVNTEQQGGTQRIEFARHYKAAFANPPEASKKRRRSIIPRGLKSELTKAFLTYEERYRTLFILSKQRKFWAKVNKTSTCWLWTGPQVHGYGQFSGSDVHILAHRYAYILENGAVEKGLHLHHECEVPLCVNPDHVLALTPAEHKAAHRALKAAKNQKRYAAAGANQ